MGHLHDSTSTNLLILPLTIKKSPPCSDVGFQNRQIEIVNPAPLYHLLRSSTRRDLEYTPA